MGVFMGRWFKIFYNREKTHENMINLLETAMRNFGTDHE